ncbi:hypothetical protein D9M68_702930 [compost metagenome]
MPYRIAELGMGHHFRHSRSAGGKEEKQRIIGFGICRNRRFRVVIYLICIDPAAANAIGNDLYRNLYAQLCLCRFDLGSIVLVCDNSFGHQFLKAVYNILCAQNGCSRYHPEAAFDRAQDGLPVNRLQRELGQDHIALLHPFIPEQVQQLVTGDSHFAERVPLCFKTIGPEQGSGIRLIFYIYIFEYFLYPVEMLWFANIY